MVTRWLRTAVLLAPCALGACQSPASKTEHGSVAALRSRAVSEEVKTALLSIYYHAYWWRKPPVEPSPLAPMDLLKAAAIVEKAPEPDANTARRRAIGILVAYSMLPNTPAGEWQPNKFKTALQVLLGSEWEKFETSLVTLVNRANVRADRSLFATAAYAQPSEDDQEAATQQWLSNQLLDGIGGKYKRRCCACLSEYEVDKPDRQLGAPGMSYYKIKVVRPNAGTALKEVVDPQNWAACYPDFFVDSYISTMGACPSNPTIQTCSGNGPNKASAPPTPGSDWPTAGVVYEHVYTVPSIGTPCPGGLGKQGAAVFRNLLKAQAGSSAKGYQVDFGCCKSLDSSINCNCKTGGIHTDCGFSLVQPIASHPDQAFMRGVKYFQFTDPALDDWTAVGLRATIDLMVEDGVCCGIEGEVECQECIRPVVLKGEHPPTAAGYCDNPCS
jgi:hypothetical protein